MNTSKRIEWETKEKIGILRIHNPPLNKLSKDMLLNLHNLRNNIQSDNIRVVILTGSGRNFSAGVDLDELSKVNSKETLLGYIKLANEFFNFLYNLDKPVIAAVNGSCLGAGVEFALACHLRISSAKALFGLPETGIGIIPGLGGTQRLPRLIGLAKAMELILSSKIINASEAYQLGMINNIASKKNLMNDIFKMAENLANKDHKSLSYALKAIKGSLTDSIEEGLKKESDYFVDLWSKNIVVEEP